MKILKFTLKGKTGFFKKPDVNTFLYFTYGNIHKVALCGVFGSILGYAGYNQMDKNMKYPQFYEKLKDIKVSIVPNNEKGFFEKKVQFFNNTVGYASKETGGNLIIKEQWLENPSWDIYVNVKDEESENICNYIFNKKSIFIPYLGKNDHLADIGDVQIFNEDDIKILNQVEKIDSLFVKDMFSIEMLNEEEEDEDYVEPFKYEENLPVSLNEETNLYEYNTFVLTNMKVKKIREVEVIKVNNKNLVFF